MTDIKYTSTRDKSVCVDGATAILDGISADGGLFVPVSLPKLEVKDFCGLDFVKRCDKLLSAFFEFDTSGVSAAAYKDFEDDPAPVVKLDDNMFMLELWHGKSHASKDISLCALPLLIARAKKAKGEDSKTLALVAADGDTCKAALESFKDTDGAQACAFYSADGVSEMQRFELQTQSGDNVCAVGVNADLDKMKAAVRAAISDESLRTKLAADNIKVTPVDSINFGSVVPQIAYYFSAYADLVDSGEINVGDEIDFVVPTGNFGNALAGYYAKKMGVPINRLVCATNENKVLCEFMDTGEYDINRQLFKTDSPALDVLIASDIERLLFDLCGDDGLIKERMASLEASGRYSITQDEIDKIHAIFACDFADDDETDDAIFDTFDEYGYVVDTYTAIGCVVATKREYVRPTVIAATVNPYKTAPAVLRALGERAEEKPTLDTFKQLEELSAMDIPQSLADAFTAPVRFTEVIEPDKIIEYLQLKINN
ncbi:MAG: threonine synthase [Clostridiales bacterium]|nr:threonine synthase [Clostridiales bacterium]